MNIAYRIINDETKPYAKKGSGYVYVHPFFELFIGPYDGAFNFKIAYLEIASEPENNEYCWNVCYEVVDTVHTTANISRLHRLRTGISLLIKHKESNLPCKALYNKWKEIKDENSATSALTHASLNPASKPGEVAAVELMKQLVAGNWAQFLNLGLDSLFKINDVYSAMANHIELADAFELPKYTQMHRYSNLKAKSFVVQVRFNRRLDHAFSELLTNFHKDYSVLDEDYLWCIVEFTFDKPPENFKIPPEFRGRQLGPVLASIK